MSSRAPGPGEVRRAAEMLLQDEVSPVARGRLLREVLTVGSDAQSLRQTQRRVNHSRQVAALREAQRADGGWGRFHTIDVAASQKIPTTEFAVERAAALGLGPGHPIVRGVRSHLSDILLGRVPFPDPPERNERWETGKRLFAAATLALIAPRAPALRDTRALWYEIACRTFARGRYDARAESDAHRECTGIRGELRYLHLSGKYQLRLLGAHPDLLPGRVVEGLLFWIWAREEGIGYWERPLHQLPAGGSPHDVEAWLSSLELIRRFRGWKRCARPAIEWLWSVRRPDGLWDLGPRSSVSRALPMADDWRRPRTRALDWSVRVLCLLARSGSGG